MSRHLGRSYERKEGVAKLRGRARYVDDMSLPGMLHGATVRSPVARGVLKKIHFGQDLPWHEFTVVTAKDIPGQNHVALILKDQPFLADTQISHPEEPVLLIAHPDKHVLEAGRRAVRLEIEEQPAVLSIEDSLRADPVIWGDDNCFKKYLVDKGNVDEVWARAAHIVEGEYFTGAQEQLYIEPNGMIAQCVPGTSVTVWGSMQCPYYVHKALVPLFGLGENDVRVIQMETGGGFGGKEEYPSLVAGHAALLAWKSGRPVKIIYDRAEDMAATTKRHPSRTRHRMAFDREGKILGMEIDFVIDGGAYATLSSVVLSRGTIHAAGPYHCENIRIRSRAVATNSPPHGAFRGFGAPQSIFALERHLDRAAAVIGISPTQIRERNFIRPGQTTATGQTISEPIDLTRLTRETLARCDYERKRAEFDEHNRGPSPIKKGIGFATFMHGSGFTGSGEKHLASVVGAELSPEGRVRVLAASTEIGQGTNTIFSQIAAEALGLEYDQIEIAQPDTGAVPNSGPTVASRTCMVVGKLVETACLKLRDAMIGTGQMKVPYTAAEFQEAARKHVESYGRLQSFAQYKQPANVEWDEEHYRGDAYAAFAWAVYVAEVSVDTRSFETRVDDFVAMQEVGRVIHPVLATGQIEGGVAQGIGYALYENVVWQKGRMVNNQMTNYIMPTSADLPPIRVHFEEIPTLHGPGGAKGIGELPMDGPAPAILNAVAQACGALANEIPLTPERLHAQLKGATP